VTSQGEVTPHDQRLVNAVVLRISIPTLWDAIAPLLVLKKWRKQNMDQTFQKMYSKQHSTKAKMRMPTTGNAERRGGIR
jgi:hypothetical protein